MEQSPGISRLLATRFLRSIAFPASPCPPNPPDHARLHRHRSHPHRSRPHSSHPHRSRPHRPRPHRSRAPPGRIATPGAHRPPARPCRLACPLLFPPLPPCRAVPLGVHPVPRHRPPLYPRHPPHATAKFTAPFLRPLPPSHCTAPFHHPRALPTSSSPVPTPTTPRSVSNRIAIQFSAIRPVPPHTPSSLVYTGLSRRNSISETVMATLVMPPRQHRRQAPLNTNRFMPIDHRWGAGSRSGWTGNADSALIVFDGRQTSHSNPTDTTVGNHSGMYNPH